MDNTTKTPNKKIEIEDYEHMSETLRQINQESNDDNIKYYYMQELDSEEEAKLV